MGQIDPCRAQFIKSSTFDITYSAAFDSPAGAVAAGGCAPPCGAGLVVDDDDLDGEVAWIDVDLREDTMAVREAASMHQSHVPGERERRGGGGKFRMLRNVKLLHAPEKCLNATFLF